MWRKRLAIFLTVILLASGLAPTVASANNPMKLEQAILVARAVFPELELDEADFVSNYFVSDDIPVWQLTWTETEGMEVRITVHANSGRILEFYRWERQAEEFLPPLPKLSEEEALAKAEAFLEKIAPEELAQCRYQPGRPLRPYLHERTRHLTYTFNFQRYANDIPFNYNGLQVNNADTGEILG